MKRWVPIAAFIIAACADVHVGSSLDGRWIRTCTGDNWVDCINQACPNGFTIINEPGLLMGVTGDVRCKP